MQIQTLFCHNSLRNLIHIFYDESTNEAICVDPFDADQAYDFVQKNKLQLKYIINTHEHFDHIRGNQSLKEKTGAQIYSVNGVRNIDKKILDQQELILGNIKIQFFHTPGHTLNHISFLANDENLFCGDMLFNAGVGRCSNGGDVTTMYHTFQSFFAKLPGSTKIYPGHDYIENNLNFAKQREPSNKSLDLMLGQAKSLRGKDQFIVTSMQQERSYNPFLRLDSKEIQERCQSIDATPEETFKCLRRLRDEW
tara:strand:- start:82 stop:837 length:756 start_codon:yes stop_codon:yes gene_type:complete